MTQAEFIEWKNGETTKAIFGILRATRDAYVKELISATGTPEANKIAGIIEAFDYLLNIDWEGE